MSYEELPQCTGARAYDPHVKLTMFAEVPRKQLYTEGPLAHELLCTVLAFERDEVSRVLGSGSALIEFAHNSIIN